MLLLLAALTASAQQPTATPATPCPPGTSETTFMTWEGVRESCQRPDGTLHGPTKLANHVDVVLESGAYDDGERAGTWRFFDTNGALQERGVFVAGERAGVWTSFAPNGEIAATVRWPEAVAESARTAEAPAPPAPTRPALGATRWSLPLGAAARQLALVGDLVLVELRGALVALSMESGEVAWTLPLGSALRPGWVEADGSAAAITGPGEVLVVALDTGAAHRIRTPMGATHAVSLGAETVTIREGAGRIEQLDVRSGLSKWRTSVAFSEVAPVLALDAVVATRGRDVRAVALDDGALAWQTRLDHEVVTLASSWDGYRVHALDAQGELLAMGAVTGKPQWSVVVPAARGKARGTTLRDDQDQLVVHTGDALLAVDREGEVAASLPLPKEAAYGGDLVGDRACWADRLGVVVCGSARSRTVDGRRALAPLAHAPIVLGGDLLVALADGRLLRLDARSLGAEEGAEATALDELHAALPVLLDPVEGPFGLEGRRATVPLVARRQAVPDRPECTTTTALLDLRSLREERVVGGGSEEAVEPAAATSEPGAGSREATRRPAKADSPDASPWSQLAIPSLALEETSLDPPAVFSADRWAVRDLRHRWSLSYWVEWRPRILELGALGGDPDTVANVERLLACEASPARFEGTALVQDGGVQRRFSGLLTVRPMPHALDDEPGCLLALSLAGEELGLWAAPGWPGWVEWSLSADDGDGGDASSVALPPVGEAGFPAESVDGTVALDFLEPGASERSEWAWDGELTLERVEAATPSASDDPGDLRVTRGGVELARIAADGLLYGEIGEHPDGEDAPVIDWRTEHALRSLRPLDPREEPLVPVWTSTSCEVADE